MRRARFASVSLGSLEPRLTPADFTAAVVGDVLTVNGSDGSNTFQLKDTGAGMEVIGDALNLVNGQTSVAFPTVNSVRLLLKNGHDIVTLDSSTTFSLSGELLVDFGEGQATSTFTKTTGFAVGSMTVKVGLGGASLTLDGPLGTIVKNLTVESSTGHGPTIAPHAYSNFDIGGDFNLATKSFVEETITMTGFTIDGNFKHTDEGRGTILTLNSTTVGGNVGLNAMNGWNRYTFNGTPINGTTGLSLNVKDNGRYQITLGGSAVNIPNGGISLMGGTSFGTLANEFKTTVPLTLGGNFTAKDSYFQAFNLQQPLSAKTITLSSGAISFGTNLAPVTATGGLSMTATRGDLDVFIQRQLAVTGNATFTALKGAVNVEVNVLGAGLVSSVTGNLTMNGNTRAYLSLVTDMTIDGNLSLTAKAADALGADLFNNGTLNVGGTVTVTSASFARIQGYRFNADGAVSIKTTGREETAEFFSTFPCTFGAGLSVTAPLGRAVVTGSGVWDVAGAMTISSLLETSALLQADQLDIGGPVTISSRGPLTAYLTADTTASSIKKDVNLSAGTGSHQFNFGRLAKFEGNINWKSTGGHLNFQSNLATQVLKSININTGVGHEVITLTDVTLGGSLTTKLGAGIDSVTLLGATSIAGSVLCDLGADDDTFYLGGTAKITGSAKYLPGTGVNTVSYVSTVAQPGNITFSGVAGHDTLVFETNAIGDGDIFFTGGDGDDILRNFGTLNGDIQASMGNGNDRLGLSATSTFTGNIKVDFGAGDDVLIGSNSLCTGTINATMGAGNDELDLDRGTVLQGAFTVDLGAGNDLIFLGQDTGQSVIGVTFQAKTVIKAGAGNDTLMLGLAVSASGDGNTQAVFTDATSIIDGGSGLDVYEPSDSQTNLPSANITNWLDAI